MVECLNDHISWGGFLGVFPLATGYYNLSDGYELNCVIDNYIGIVDGNAAFYNLFDKNTEDSTAPRLSQRLLAKFSHVDYFLCCCLVNLLARTFFGF